MMLIFTPKLDILYVLSISNLTKRVRKVNRKF